MACDSAQGSAAQLLPAINDIPYLRLIGPVPSSTLLTTPCGAG
jgi:hypothetical protein